MVPIKVWNMSASQLQLCKLYISATIFKFMTLKSIKFGIKNPSDIYEYYFNKKFYTFIM